MNRVLLRWSVAFVLLLAVGPTAAAAQEVRRVLVLHSEQWMAPALALFTQNLRESLASSPAISVEAQFLDITRPAGEARDRELADWLQSRFRGRQFAAVVPIGVPASVFATRYGETIWPGARLVHASIDGDQVRVAKEHGDPVIPRAYQYRQTVEFALQLFPTARRVWLIGGASAQDHRFLDVAEADLASLHRRIRIERVCDLRWDDLLAKVRHIPDDTIALGVVFGADADGRAFVIADALLDIARVADRPFFVVGSWYIGTGAVGGYVLDAAELGRAAAALVLHTLDKPGVVDASLEETPTRWMFDDVQLRRWNVSESKLPAGSIILNRELPVWRRYIWPLMAAALLVALQGTIIGALLVQRRNRRRIEVALRESEGKARASYNEARELAGRLITAREEERARIARDLHDDIGQRVASLSIGLSRAQRNMPDASGASRQALSALEQQTTQLSADLRHLSHELHPSALEHLGLLEALRERCDDFTQDSGVAVRLDVSDTWPEVSNAFALCLYRVAQEALRNVARHAQARQVTVALDRLDGHLTMQVSDDGCGFDPTNATARRKGLGLISLAERVRMLGGELAITAGPGNGTHLAVTLPAGESHAS
jgi:signal transduction histidine kinase